MDFQSNKVSTLTIAKLCVAILSLVSSTDAVPIPVTGNIRGAAPINVTQHHNHASRDGLYIDPAFTLAAAAKLARDLTFDGTIVGAVYAQPLYLDNGPEGRPTVIAVTESNNVYALDAVDGSIIWERNMGDPVLQDEPTCAGDIHPLGITGTPIIDIASRALFFNAMTMPDAVTKKHFIFSLNVDTGDINPG